MPEGYRLFYLKRDLTILEDGEVTELPFILSSIIIPFKLRSSAMRFIEENGRSILSEGQIRLWCNENGMVIENGLLYPRQRSS